MQCLKNGVYMVQIPPMPIFNISTGVFRKATDHYVLATFYAILNLDTHFIFDTILHLIQTLRKVRNVLILYVLFGSRKTERYFNFVDSLILAGQVSIIMPVSFLIPNCVA